MAFVANARQITQEEAYVIASKFFNYSNLYSPPKQIVNVRKGCSKQVSDYQPYYIFNKSNKQGFVIVAGDTRLKKIIGYSDTGTFDVDNIPPQLSYILSKYAEKLKREPEIHQSDPSWNVSVSRSGGSEILLKTPDWGQNYPYNDKCPTINGVKSPTGCIATAMAIVMKYHKFPTQGKNIFKYFDWDTNQQETIDLSKYIFNWDDMFDTYSKENYTDDEVETISKLMQIIAYSTNSGFSPTATESNGIFMANAFHRYFKYSQDLQLVNHWNYDIDTWFSKIKSEIDNKCPVIMLSDGHAYVIDGYDNENNVHINWGWDGFANGYYDVENAVVLENKYSGGSGLFSLHPASKNELEYSDCVIGSGFVSDYEYKNFNFNVSTNEIFPNAPFDVSTPQICVPSDFNGSLGIALVNKNNEIKEIVGERKNWNMENDDIINIGNPGTIFSGSFAKCMMTKSLIEDGDKLCVVSKEKDEECWRFIYPKSEIPTMVYCNKLNADYSNVNISIDPRFEFLCTQNSEYFGDDHQPVFISTDINSMNTKLIKGLYLNFSGFSNNYDEIDYSTDPPTINYKRAFKVDSVWLPDVYLASIHLAKDSHKVEILGSFPDDGKILEITVPKAGSLNQMINYEEAHLYRDLNISGHLNCNDLDYIKNNMVFAQSLNLANAKIENGSITTEQFYLCRNIQELIIPENVERIEERAFAGNMMDYITLPSTLKEIGAAAFETSLSRYPSPRLAKAIYCKATTPPVLNGFPFGSEELLSDTSETILFVKPGCSNVYRNAPGWCKFINIVESDNPEMSGCIIPVDMGKTYNKDVYNIHGQCIKHDASQSEIDALSPGLYIIGGKKVLIRNK